jgi:predicted unusual protein kinase regulating ubiquinone biosynthesis (AarF/ABC1/UbiB family)
MRTNIPRINRLSQLVRFVLISRLLLWTIWVIYRERQRVVHARERGDYKTQPNIEVLIRVLVAYRVAALKFGVLMIKLGQFLSSRADLLPEEALGVLASLQDEVPPAPFEHVVSVIESEYGKPLDQIFSFFERKCTAAASLGQVHRATLASTGETVAVKIQRPNVEQLCRMDLSTLRFVIWLINIFIDTSDFIDLVAFYREFQRTVYEEIDYVTEAAYSKRFKEMFANDSTIYIPSIHDQYISHHVLVIEWIDGIKVNDYVALDALGVDRLEVAKRIVQAYFYQFFVEGFFHADPHPGNIFVKKGVTAEGGPVIAFIDFGMVGSLTKSMKQALKGLFIGFIARDSRGLVNSLVKLGFVGQGANLASIERGMSMMMEQYYGLTLGGVRELEIPDVAQDVERLLYDQPFQIPAQFAFTGRAISTLSGVATGLAPEFNFVEVATPYARKFLGLDSEGANQTFQDILNQVVTTGQTLLSLPRSLEQLISKLETGQIEVKLANERPRERIRLRRPGRRRGGTTRSVDGSTNAGLAWTLMFVASLAGGIYLMTTHLMLPAWFCLGLAAFTALGLLVRR